MKFAAIIPITAAIVNLAVTFFVLTRNLRARVNWVYLLWGLSITVWNLGVAFLFKKEQPTAEAIIWAQVVQFGVVFLPISLFHLCLLVAQVPPPKLLRYLYCFHGLLAVSNFTRLFVADVRWVGYAYYTVGGPAFWLFIVSYTFVAVRTTFLMYRRQRELPPKHRSRLRALLGANVLLIVFGTNDILPILGVTQYPFTHLTIYPLGSGAAVLYGLLVAYSAVQHELLGARVTLSRFAAHLARILFVFCVGALLLVAFKLWKPDSFPPYALISGMVGVLASAVIAAVYFPRLFGRSDEALERWILGDQFEYRDRVRRFIISIPSYSDTDSLMKDLQDLLVNTMSVRRHQIILMDQATQVFSLYRAHPEEAQKQLPDLKLNSPLLQLFAQTEAKVLAFNLAYAAPGETKLEHAAREQLRQFSPEFCFPFSYGGEPAGLLLIGEKANGAFYTMDDQQLFIELVRSLGLVINQIRLTNEVLEAKELELLGRMSRGLAHDLNNLITPISTFLQLAQLGPVGPDVEAELLPVALRSMEVIRTYVRESLFVSEHRTPQFQQTELGKLVKEVCTIHEPAARAHGAAIGLDWNQEVFGEVDPVLLQRLVGNLVVNAIDASKGGSGIRVEISRLSASDRADEWLRLKVIDEGVGMAPDVLRQIDTPYFTTKVNGDEHRGFGLGLAICRKITHLHGGHLRIDSMEGRGTTVQVDLPARHEGAVPHEGNAR